MVHGRAILVLLAGVAVAASAWLLGAVALSPSPAPAEPADIPAVDVGRQPPGLANAADRRQRVDTPALGSLRLRAIWDDATAAADVPLCLHPSGGDALFGVRTDRTDAGGELRFVALQPGKYYVTADRGGAEMPAILAVEAGREQQATIELAGGVLVRGIVVGPDDRPLVGADVVVTRWGGGAPVVLTSSDAAGRFQLRSVSGRAGIGARAPGFVPSLLQVLSVGAGAIVDVRIVLRGGGGSLHGRVLDRAGRPVADAVVRVGDDGDGRPVELPDGTRGVPQTPLQTRTDRDGGFALPCLPAGEQPVAVRAEALAPWRGSVQLRAGCDEELLVHLQVGASLRGSVRDGGGAAVVGADVYVGETGGLGSQWQTTGADGSFAFTGLGTGELPVRVASEHGRAATVLSSAPGAELRWDAVLSRGCTVRGRVLDNSGEPVARAAVTATNLPGGTAWGASAVSGEDGRFDLLDCAEGEPFEVAARRGTVFPELRLRQPPAGPEPLLLRLPPAASVRIRGRVVDADGAAVADVSLYPVQRGASSSPLELCDAATGAFDLGPYPAGDYALTVRAAGFVPVRLPWRPLGGDDVWNVGTLHLDRGGRLLARLSPSLPPPPVALRLAVLDADGQLVQPIELHDATGRAGPLAAGDYLLQVRGLDVACAELPFAVRTGSETVLDVPLQAAVAVDFEFADVGLDAERLRVEVRDEAGRPVLRTDVPKRPDGFRLSAAFAAGSYRLVASGNGAEGGEGSAGFAVGAGGRSRVVVRLKK